MTKEYVTEPLLYIEQPELEKPTAVMQEIYDGSSKKKKLEKEGEDEQAKNILHHSQSFQRLSIQDKISYLLTLPKEVPRLKCRISTSDMTYHGVVIGEDGEEILLQQHGQKRRRIKKESILNIQLLGF